MNFTFTGKRISSVIAVVPKNVRHFDDEIEQFNFAKANSQKLKLVMGFDKHRVVDEGTCASDLCLHGLMTLLDRGVLKREDISALLFVSQSPDHLIPPTSNIIQGKAGLSTEVLCVDINQGCAGYLLGLMQAFMLLDQTSVRKVVLLNGDTLSRRVGKRDRNIYPMIGDAGAVTVVERGPADETIYASVQMDGGRSHALQIPAGGFRQPSTPATAVEVDLGDGNFRSADQFFMDGPAVFNFVQTTVPPMIDALLAASNVERTAVDAFLFHQPNKFMLKKLADKMQVPYERLPNNIVENFGNASSATIPTNIVFNLADCLRRESLTACLAGFGVGLTWSSMLLRLGPLDACEMCEYEGADVAFPTGDRSS